MPRYDLKNKETGEVIEKIMKISEKEEWLEQNPQWEQVHLVAPTMGDPVRLGVTRMDNGFREVLQKIHEKSPGSKLKDSIR